MRKLPKLTRKRDLFTRRFIITMPPWAPFVVAGAVGLAVLVKSQVIVTAFTAFCMGMALLSAIFCRIAWLHLKEMRYALHNAINDIDNEDLDPEALEDQVWQVPGA